MAVENTTNSNTDAAVTDAPATKRKYAPRSPKAAVDMMGGMTARNPRVAAGSVASRP
jgi:hypothetical protein